MQSPQQAHEPLSAATTDASPNASVATNTAGSTAPSTLNEGVTPARTAAWPNAQAEASTASPQTPGTVPTSPAAPVAPRLSDEQRKAAEDRLRAAAVVGCTGLVGSEILKTLLSAGDFHDVTAFNRNPFPHDYDKHDPYRRLRPQVHKPSDDWPTQVSDISPVPATFLSALGTTRGQAGGFQNQYKIDYQLNYDLAKAMKEAGTRFYVLVSGAGANSKSSFSYVQMKGKLEDDVKALNFERTIILQPGLLVGTRRDGDSRPPELALRKLASCLGRISGNRLKDFWAQDADVIGRAAVAASMQCMEEARHQPDITTPLKPEVRVLSQSDIVRMGRTEWDQRTASTP